MNLVGMPKDMVFSRSRPSAGCSTLIVFLSAFFSNLPRFLDFKTTTTTTSVEGGGGAGLAGDSSLGGQLIIETTALNEDQRYIVFNSYFELLTTGVLPLSALCYYNYVIYR